MSSRADTNRVIKVFMADAFVLTEVPSIGINVSFRSQSTVPRMTLAEEIPLSSGIHTSGNSLARTGEARVF